MNAKPSELFIVSVINWIVVTVFYICAGILKLKWKSNVINAKKKSKIVDTFLMQEKFVKNVLIKYILKEMIKMLVLNSKLEFTDGTNIISLAEATGILEDYIDGELVYRKDINKELLNIKE